MTCYLQVAGGHKIHATVKPISANCEKILDSAIANISEITSKKMADLGGE